MPGIDPVGRIHPDRSDEELVAAVRHGDTDAYAELYRRHINASRGFAQYLVVTREIAEDVLAESFARVLAQIKSGGGPTTNFRSYLFRAIRVNLSNYMRRDRRLELTDEPSPMDEHQEVQDPVGSLVESMMLTRALATLPQRWQEVLWRIDVQGETAASLAKSMNMSPNAVAALSYRAREGLRNAYIQCHFQPSAPECEPVVSRLGAWLRDRLSEAESATLDEHIADCTSCSELLDEVLALFSRLSRSNRKESDGRSPAERAS